MIDRRGISRFAHYSLIGGGTFLLDLLLLFVFIDVFAVYYLAAAAVAFAIAVSCNYVISRRFIFSNTTRGYKTGYVNFLLIAGAGLCFVTLGMYVLVDILECSPIISRVGVAMVTGVWNYLMNLFVNFKTAGT
ncbi:MAG: hypothetical protein RLZZ480_742 [Candidatus Parcubacteria bacterium]|jgi:putative flippase GtrA